MNRIIRIFATAMVACTAAACIPAGTLPGTLEVTKSKFDDRKYVRAAPGWVRSIGSTSVWEQSGFKIGAVIHSEEDPSLIVRVGSISRILDLELKLNNHVIKPPRIGLTDIRTSGSRAAFRVKPFILESMTSGKGTALIRVTTSKGYHEGDFGADCDSRWHDRACIAIRNALAKAKAVGLIEN